MHIARLLTEDKYYRRFLFGLVLAGGISFLIVFYLVWTGPFRVFLPNAVTAPGRDFSPLYYTAVAFSEGKDPSTLNFIYFPLTLFYYLPLSHLGFYSAFFVITIWNLLMALVIATLATKILKYYRIRLPAATKWFIFLAYIFFCPVTAELNSGNVNTLVACFTAMFYYFLCVKDKNLYSALSLVVATLFKVFPVFLLLFAAIKRKFKFILVFLAILAVFGIVSILLLGVPAHVHWFEYLTVGDQSGAALTFSANSTISAIIYKSLEFFGIKEAGQNIIINISWLVIRLAFMVLIFRYLYPLSGMKGGAFRDNQWTILSFSLFSVLMISLPNRAWVYYASCLALPFILCVFCLKLSLIDKVLLALSIAFFSFNTHIDNLAGLIGGAFGSLDYLLPSSSIGNLLFLAFVLLHMVRLKWRNGAILRQEA
jgi:hypothetical protein